MVISLPLQVSVTEGVRVEQEFMLGHAEKRQLKHLKKLMTVLFKQVHLTLMHCNGHLMHGVHNIPKANGDMYIGTAT